MPVSLAVAGSGIVVTVPHISTITNAMYQYKWFSLVTSKCKKLSASTLLNIIIIKNKEIRVTLCQNAAGTLYIVNRTCVDGQRKVHG